MTVSPPPNQTEHVRDLDRRVTVVETKIDFIQETVEHTKDAVEKVDRCLAKQNGVLPRLETGLNTLNTQLQEYKEKSIASATRSKLVWGVVASVGTAVILILLKVALGL
jgi:uncharacterized coiled-coil protein SlyX